MPLADRISRVRNLLGGAEVDALLVTDEVNVRYLSGFTGDSTALLITASDQWILSDRRYEQQVATECPQWRAAIRGPERRMPELMVEVTTGLGVRVLGLEDHAVSWSLQRTLASRLEGIQLTPTNDWIAGLRAIKDAGEIATLRRAVECAEEAFFMLRFSLDPDMTERDAAERLEVAIREADGSGVGFDSIIAVGAHSALPHHRPTDTPIGDSGTLLIDWGARVDGYTSDMTRTLSIGSISKRMREVYTVVLEAQLAAIEQIRTGARACDVDAAARRVIERAGYGDAFVHGLGHGIGMQVHESPRMAAPEEGRLAAGMVVTVEPGIYLPGDFGVRIEDDVLVTESGHEVLGSLAKGLEESLLIL